MKKYLIIIAMALSLASCSDSILDISPKDRISDDAVWSNESLIKAYHTELYNCIFDGFTKIHMQSKATDETYCSINWGIGIMQAGTLTADNVTNVADTDWAGGGQLYIWNTAYKYIRKINLFLEKMESLSISISDKETLIAEAKFLRALTYFELIARFGGVPLVNQSYAYGTEQTFTSNTFDECVDFINKDLEDAIKNLPQHYATTDANFGRATQDACRALRSRLYLYAASPLFNESNDKAKWQKSAVATKEFLDNNGGYSLYPDYEKCFNQSSGTANNEIIFARNFTTTNGHQFPVNNLGRRYSGYGGWWASNGPSQNLVDDYDMLNGEPPFIWTNGVKTVNPKSGYDPQNPYSNRDPRFYATIIYDGSVYHGDKHEMWIASDANSWGYDSYKQSSDNPRTNYIIRKFMPADGVEISWSAKCTTPWIIFRLGEIYLNYAEAEFELGNEDVCREYLNKVRARAGLPGLDSSVTGETLRQRMYNERRIEMAFEDQRYFDVRRWKIAMDTENRPIYGMDIFKDVKTGVKTYSPVKLSVRSFTKQMYLLPIATEEIKKNNGALLQSVTWR